MKKTIRAIAFMMMFLPALNFVSCSDDGGDSTTVTDLSDKTPIPEPESGKEGENNKPNDENKNDNENGNTEGDNNGEAGEQVSNEPQTFAIDKTDSSFGVPEIIKSGFTITFDKDAGQTAPGLYGDGIRLYANNKITVTPLTDSTMTKIVFVESGQRSAPLTVSTGNITQPTGTAGNEVIWEGATSSPLVITVGASGQFRFNSITITYKGGITPPSEEDSGNQGGGESGNAGEQTGTGAEKIELPENTGFTPGEAVTTGFAENTALYLGNPTGAVTNVSFENNYLMQKMTFALSYNNTTHNPNWVSWHLCKDDMGGLPRASFTADTALPEGWYRVTDNDYKSATFNGMGMTRGHMCPNMDRNKDSEIQKEVFLMTNMVPQTANNNNTVWAGLETQEVDWANAGKELYIICGPYGIGGTYHPTSVNFIGTVYGNSTRINYISITNPTNASDPGIVVPATTWRVVLVMDEGTGDLERITAENTTAIAINLPNTYECKYTSTGAQKTWKDYICTIDEIEELTGYDFFANLPDEIENVLEAKRYQD